MSTSNNSSKTSTPTQLSVEELISLPSTSQISNIVSRHQLQNSHSFERPLTAAPYSGFTTVVSTATQSGFSKRNFSAHAKRSSTIVTLRSTKSRNFAYPNGSPGSSTEPLRHPNGPPKSPLRAQSFALEPSAQVITNIQSVSGRERILPRSLSASIPDFHSSYSVLAFMHCGTFEAAANSRWLCSNKISYIINLTGVQRLKVRSCPCPNPKYHTPTEYTPKIDYSTPMESILDEFSKINNFIAEARSKNIQVLIFNKDAQDLCQATAIQYIMDYHKIPLSHAIAHLQKNDNIKVRISPTFMDALRQWEQKTVNDGVNKAIEAMIKAPFSIEIERRLAWL
ncbi:hypothetical protein FO519_006684 [Halicephalobus sp. NKZ332]|nr:hypothetical protein FO519_006684 [Halicephalobus sp. NKZ332]